MVHPGHHPKRLEPNVLVHQIESGLYRRQGKALTNFTRTMPACQSELAQQVVKDPYNFEFLTLAEEAREQELERALINHLRDFLLELGVGFAFVGSQYPIQVGGEEFRIDLLFYHLRLRCFVVLDLKMTRFQPEYCTIAPRLADSCRGIIRRCPASRNMLIRGLNTMSRDT